MCFIRYKKHISEAEHALNNMINTNFENYIESDIRKILTEKTLNKQSPQKSD